LVATFWILGNFLATFWHSSEQLSSILRAQSGQAYMLVGIKKKQYRTLVRRIAFNSALKTA